MLSGHSGNSSQFSFSVGTYSEEKEEANFINQFIYILAYIIFRNYLIAA